MKINLLSIILGVLLVLTLLTQFKNCSTINKYKEDGKHLLSMLDNKAGEAKLYKDSNGDLVAEVEAMSIANQEILQVLAKIESLPPKTRVKYVIDAITKDSIVYVSTTDTMYFDSSLTSITHPKDILYPTYSEDIDNPWFQGQVTMSKDSTKLNLAVIDSFHVVGGLVPQGWFKEPKTKFYWRSLNPNSLDTKLHVYEADTDLPRLSLGASVGVAYYPGAPVNKPGPYIGFGINYRLCYLGKVK